MAVRLINSLPGSEDKLVGANHPTLPDALNRPLQDVLSGSGYKTDGTDFAGMAKTAHTHLTADLTDFLSTGSPTATDANASATDYVFASLAGVLRRLGLSSLAKWLNARRGIYSVVDFGAAGDGVTDDRAAIAAADAAAVAAGGTVLFSVAPGHPATNYLIASNLTIASPVIFRMNAKLAPAAAVTVTLNGPVAAGDFQICTTGAGAITFGDGAIDKANVLWWGATRYSQGGSFAIASDAAFNAAIAAVQNLSTRVIEVKGGYRINANLVHGVRGYRYEGLGGRVRYSSEPGSAIYFYGSGALLQNGTSKVVGAPLYDPSYENPDYDGLQGFTTRGIYFKHNAPDTPLANGLGSYKAGSMPVQDWRGGNIDMEDCSVESFDYHFWGIQSDFNRIVRCDGIYLHNGLYPGPRSDQFVVDTCTFTDCDTALWVDRTNGLRLTAISIVGCGSATTPAVKVLSQYTSGCGIVKFSDSPWFERLQGYVGTVNAFIEVGKGGTVTEGEVIVEAPTIKATNATYATSYFAEADHANVVKVIDATGSFNLLTKFAKASGSGSPEFDVNALPDTMQQGSYDFSASTGKPVWKGPGGNLQVQSQRGGTGSVTLTPNDAGVCPFSLTSSITVTLPSASSMKNRLLTIKRADTTGNVLTVAAAGTDTIDGAATTTIPGNGVLRLIPNFPGNAWLVL